MFMFFSYYSSRYIRFNSQSSHFKHLTMHCNGLEKSHVIFSHHFTLHNCYLKQSKFRGKNQKQHFESEQNKSRKVFFVKNTTFFFIKLSAGLQHLDPEKLNFDSDNESGESNWNLQRFSLNMKYFPRSRGDHH